MAGRARLVRVAEERIPAYAASLPLDQAPELDPAHHYLEPERDPEGTVAFVVTLDAINFGCGYFPHLRKLPGLSGYFTVASRLAEHFRRRGPFEAERLTQLTARDCARIFAQDPAEAVVMELMGLFAQALNALGGFLGGFYGGRFSALVEHADHSAERLVESLARMPFFDDVQPYKELRVPFYKRAQLTAADLSLAFGGQSWGGSTT